MQVSLVLVLTALSSAVVGYRVLVITPVPSRSHSSLAKGIVDPLLDAGHEVTWLVPYTEWPPHKRLRIIDGSATTKLNKDIDMTKRKSDFNFVKEMAVNMTKITAANQELRETLTRDQYDAVVTEWFFSDFDAGYAAVQQVPWILLSGMIMHPHLEWLVDEIRSIPTVPTFLNDYGIPMTFVERTLNAATFGMMWASGILDTAPEAARYKASFGPIAAARRVPLPPYRDALHNISVVLVNSHPSMAPALSLPPNVVDIGGYHIGEAKPLPKDIQTLLDSSPEGVVYFSMGSVLTAARLPMSLRQDLIRMLGALPCKVLWKFEEELSGLPSNIIVKKWWPQAAVLAHPNVKLFITHGGLLSKIEAIHYGVPLLAIPVFGDQPSNAARAVRLGFAQTVPYSETMAPELAKALAEMLNNDSYYKQAKYLSKIFNKRPVQPRDLITHYIEMAIESKGAYHLRSTTHQYAWYQRWFLDQLAALIALLYGIYATVTTLCRRGQKPGRKVKKN